MGGMRGRARALAFVQVGLLCAAAGILSGCWDRIEVNDLALVTAAAFDAAPGGGERVTLQVVVPKNLPAAGGAGPQSGGGAAVGPVVSVVSGTGRSIADAVSRIQHQIPGQVFWGEAVVVLVGQSLAQAGVSEVLDFVLRDVTARISTDVLVTRGDAGPYLLVTPPYEPLPADNLRVALRRGLLPNSAVYLFARSLEESGRGFAAPVLVVTRPAPPGAAAGAGNDQTGAAVPEDLGLSGVGVFSGPRLVGWLTAEQTRGAPWLTGPIRGGSETLEDDGAVLSIRLTQTSIHRRAVRWGKGAAISIQIETWGSLVNVRGGTLDLSRPQVLAGVNTLLESQIREQALVTLHAVQAMDADAFDFGGLVAAYQPAVWRQVHNQWRAVFPSVPVVIRVLAHIRNTGNLINAPSPLT